VIRAGMAQGGIIDRRRSVMVPVGAGRDKPRYNPTGKVEVKP